MAQNSNSEAQSEIDEKTALEKEVEIAKQKQQLAEAKKAEAEALKAAAEAKLPSTETKGLEGTVTVEKGAGYYAEILAYEAMEDCAVKIAEKLKVYLSDGPLLILGTVDLAEEASLWNLLKIKLDYVTNALVSSIEKYPNIGQDYDLETYESLLPALAAAPAILGAAADITAFFKTKRAITVKNVTINEQALISVAANKIQETNKSLEIILPGRDLSGQGALYNGIINLMAKRNEVLTIREVLNNRFAEVIKTYVEKLTRLKTQKSVLNKTIDKAIADGRDASKLLKKLEQIEVDMDRSGVYERNRTNVITRLDKEITAADELIKAFTEKPANKLSPLESVAAIEQIKKNPTAKLLYLSIVSQGGEIETSQSLFSQGRVSYLGGTVISYALTNIDGEYLSSGNEQKIRTATFKRRKGTVSMKKDTSGSH